MNEKNTEENFNLDDTSIEELMRLWRLHLNDIHDVYPTGFPELDAVLEGGISVGSTTFVAGIPGIGKTAWLMQVAKNIMKLGHDVIFLSTEVVGLMAANIFIKQKMLAVESTVDKGASTEISLARLEEAADELELECKPHLHMKTKEQWKHTVEEILPIVDAIINRYNLSKPVVIIDYLQDLHSDKLPKSATPKETVDYALYVIDTILTTYGATVICSSAVNRDNYNVTMPLNALRDSSMIEYHADTVIGLELHGVGNYNFSYIQAMAAEIRDVDLIVLKQKWGACGARIRYDFIWKYVSFVEKEGKEEKEVTPKESIRPAFPIDSGAYTEDSIYYDPYEGLNDIL